MKPHVLLAEDEEIIADIIRDLLEEDGFRITVCRDGLEAWQRLHEDCPGYDVILLDRGLPGLDGLELLRRLKADPALSRVPVIMETAQSDEHSIREGLNEGAYYYLTKPIQPDVLLGVVRAALEQARELHEMLESVRRAERPLVLMRQGSFRFRDLEEGHLLADFIARACPDPERVVQGLRELLVNAVEHGNLGIRYAEKSRLLLEGLWHEEVLHRLTLPEYRDREVEVEFARGPERLQFTIRDQGQGFDWRGYLDFAPERAFDLHGRGIAMAAKLSFDGLEYQGNGNTVLAWVKAGGMQPSHDAG
ncbi:MAG: response regulator [Thiobacillus sp.]|nr:response regulator [Thiobacillus sp.]